jgi:hypothetical protein
VEKLLLACSLIVTFVIGAAAQNPDQKPEPAKAALAAPEPASAPAPAAAPASVSTRIVPNSKVYIQPMEGFENYLIAAFRKKKVQLLPVADKDLADYIISGTSVDKKAGWAKIVFMGNVHSDNAASITMTDKKSGVVVYAYAVDKKSTMHGQQTTAEACAKHLQAHMENRE